MEIFHNTNIVQQKMKELMITHVHIPPRMTNLLQPADVCWFRPLKSHYHRLWNEWFTNGAHTYTRNDNARSPGYVKCIEWLSLMWDHFESHNIINSFEFCGVVNQYKLHQALNHIVNKKQTITDYIDTAETGDNIDGFDSDEEIFTELSEPHVTLTPINIPQISPSQNLTSDIIPSYQAAPSNNNDYPFNNEQSIQYDTNTIPIQNHHQNNAYPLNNEQSIQYDTNTIPIQNHHQNNAYPLYNLQPIHYNQQYYQLNKHQNNNQYYNHIYSQQYANQQYNPQNNSNSQYQHP